MLSENEKEIIFEIIKIFTKESEFTKILDDIGQPDWGVDLHGKLIKEKIVSVGKDLNNRRPEVLKTIDNEMNQLWDISKKNIAYYQTKP